jgi:phosphoserine aminotransferase
MKDKLHCDPIPCNLIGVDGNAFALMGHWRKNAKRAGRTQEEIKLVLDEAMQGDYNQLISTLLKYCK